MIARRGPLRPLILGGLLLVVVVAVTITAALTALVGSGLPCGVGGGSAMAAGPAPTKTALGQIPPRWLAIYREAGSALDISWPFLASIGWQECGDGSGACHGVNPSGCAGPMEIAYVRGSECSPDPSVPTIWERFRTDGNGDGKTSILSPADAVFTAAKILRRSDDAPPAGGSYAGYRQAACNYYGACSDPSADYAAEVMARAVGYGFGDAGSEASGAVGGEGAAGEPGEAEEAGAPRTGGAGSGKEAGEAPGKGGAAGPPPPPSGSVCEGGSLTASSASGSEIVRIAESQLGYHEYVNEEGVGNCQKYGPCESWCALFLYWVWERAGVPLEGGPPERAYSGSPYDWVREHGGRDLPSTATPAPGDAVMYGADLGDIEHVGIVERVFPDGEITTIAGNFGDEVARSGPFDPADAATAGGQPAEIFAYAEPPTGEAGEGGAGPSRSRHGRRSAR